MERVPRAIGRVRVVRHHHDRFAVIAVERLQQVENLIAGFSIEIAGGFVAKQQRRIGDDGARDADALLLPAGKLSGIVLRPLGQPNDLQRNADTLLTVGLRKFGEQQRQLDIPLGGFWDVSSFTILVGMIFTRVGCLLNGCCAGRPSGIFGVHLPNAHGVWEKRIPTQILEAVWATILVIAAAMIWHMLPFSGALFLFVVAGYAVGRLALESARELAPGARGFTIHHAISLGMIVLSLAAFTANWPK